RAERLDQYPVVVVQPEAMPGRCRVRRLEGNDAKPHIGQLGERDQAVELAEHDLWWTEPEAQRRLRQYKMEPLVRPVQDFLALHPCRDRLVDVVWHLEPADALGEPLPRVLRGLQQAGNHRGLEDPEKSGLLVPLDQLLLVRPQ